MGAPQYPVDLIAIRDAKLKLQRSVIKYWNVNYIMVEEESESEDLSEPISEESPEVPADIDPDALAAANEIFARLEAERMADEAEKAAEIAAAFAAQDNSSDFNASTGSYSGAYGKENHLDSAEQSQVSHILSQRHDAISDLIKGLQNESDDEDE